MSNWRNDPWLVEAFEKCCKEFKEIAASAPLTPEEAEADSIGSYNVCVQAIGEQYRAGRPLPECMLSRNNQWRR